MANQSRWSVLVRLLIFKGQRQQLAVILLFVINFMLVLYTLNDEIDGDRNVRGGQNKLVAMGNSPGADIFLLQDTISEFGNYSEKTNHQNIAISTSNVSNDGYSLAKRIHARCMHSTQLPYTDKKVKVFLPYLSSNNKVQLCAIWKVGNTFFKRVFMIENQIDSAKMTLNPYDLLFKPRYVQSNKFMSNSESSWRVMFTRDPYSRLYSAYVDKLFAPNPLYWRQLGVHVIKTVRKRAFRKSLRCGHDLKFSEYIKYVVLTLTNSKAGGDGHFIPMMSWCRPCDVRYDYIGKLESFGSDSLELLQHMNMTHTERILRERGEELAADDAIRDTLDQAFDSTFRSHYNNCITIKDALFRSWRKLQYRGLIGNQTLRLSDTEIQTLSLAQATEMARKARTMSSKEERKEMKSKLFKDMYSTVNSIDMERLKQVYKNDFHLFEYDDTPADLFAQR